MAPDGAGAGADNEDLVRAHTRLAPVPGLEAIVLHLAHPGGGLGRLGGAEPPYWAFAWPGGLALARHVLAIPETVRGRRVLDLGAGSGLVAIAAAMAGAGSVGVAEPDPLGRAAIGLNARANGVKLASVWGDVTGGPAPAVDLVLAGDVFYEAGLARRMRGFLERCVAGGIAVLIGDPGRAHLPRAALAEMAEYEASEVGAGHGRGTVFAWRAAGEPAPRKGGRA